MLLVENRIIIFITMLIILLFLGAFVHNVESGSKLFTATDMHQLYKMGSPQMSSNGKKIAFMLRKWNKDDDKRYYQIDVLDIASKQISNVVKLDTNPVSNAILDPNGDYCAFFSDGQVWIVPSTGGKSTQITSFPPDLELMAMKWSPSGSYLLISIRVYESCSDLTCTSQKVQERIAYGPNTYYIYDKTFVRHWSEYKIEGYDAHLFVLPVSPSSGGYKVTGKPIDIMPTLDCETPIPPFGGLEEFDITNDETMIAFNCKLQTQDAAWATDWKIFTVKVDPKSFAVSTPTMISHTDARTQDPSFTPDGLSLIYSSMDLPGLESDKLHLVVHNISSSQETLPGNTWEYSVDGVKLCKVCGNSQYFIFATYFGQNHQVMAMNVKSGSVQTLVANGMNSDLYFSEDGGLVYSKSSVYFPTELFSTPLTCVGDSLVPGQESQLTTYNNAALSQFDIPKMTEFQFQSRDQKYTVHGCMILPPNFDETKKYPVAHLIHGGPEGVWDYSWSTRWNPQLWAAAGYVTVMINPRGSVGFGQNFTEGVWQDWGGMPYFDLMDGLTYLFGEYAYMDESRLTACGASYGGFMVNWINTQNSRYKALVCHDGLWDTESFYYSTDEIWFSEAEFGGGTPEYKDNSGYDKFNPRKYCDQMNTPQLVFHGGMDFRIPEAQGLGVFTCLQRRGVESKLIVLPQECHFVLRERNGIMWYDEVIAWLDSHTS